MGKKNLTQTRGAGFSLAELIVSIGILAVFMSFSVVTLGSLDSAYDPVEAEAAEAASWIRCLIAQANNERRELRFMSIDAQRRTRLTASWPGTNESVSWQAEHTAYGTDRTDAHMQSSASYMPGHQTLSPGFELIVYRVDEDKTARTRWRIKVSVRGMVTCYQDR